MSLIVTGSIGIDSIEAPTGNANEVLGGSAIYFAAAASYFGPVRLVGAVGDDFPQRFLETFKHFKVDLAGLEQRKGSKTFRWRGKYHTNMNIRDTLEVQLNVLAEPLPPVPQHYCDSRFVFLANTHPAGQLELRANFPNASLVVADTMDLWIETEQKTLRELLKKIDGLVLNDSEATMLTGESNLIRAAEKILALGPSFVVVKKGEHGSFLQHRHGRVSLPAFPAREVIDPTGAGDSFAGGMMGYLASAAASAAPGTAGTTGGGLAQLSLDTVRKAMAYGTVVASFNIEAFSIGRLMQISRADIDQRFDEYRTMLHIP